MAPAREHRVMGLSKAAAEQSEAGDRTRHERYTTPGSASAPGKPLSPGFDPPRAARRPHPGPQSAPSPAASRSQNARTARFIVGQGRRQIVKWFAS